MPSFAVGLLTIGEFSRLSQFSVRMLRYYDANGLLQPTLVDPATGYRYYSGGQLQSAGRIRTLRDVGCSVAEIGRMLPLFGSPAELAQELAAQRSRLEGEASRIDEQLREIDRLSAHLKEVAMSIEVRQLEVPGLLVAAVRDQIPSYADEGELWGRLNDALAASDAELDFASPMAVSAAFHDAEYKESDVDVEVRVAVTGPFSPSGSLACLEVAPHTALSAVLHGPYEGVGAVSEELGRQVAVRGLRISAPMYNVYLVGPGQSDNPEEWVTDIRVPVEPAA